MREEKHTTKTDVDNKATAAAAKMNFANFFITVITSMFFAKLSILFLFYKKNISVFDIFF